MNLLLGFADTLVNIQKLSVSKLSYVMSKMSNVSRLYKKENSRGKLKNISCKMSWVYPKHVVVEGIK